MCQVVDAAYEPYIAFAAIVLVTYLIIHGTASDIPVLPIQLTAHVCFRRAKGSLKSCVLSKSFAGCDRQMGVGNTKQQANLLPSFLPSLTSFEI